TPATGTPATGTPATGTPATGTPATGTPATGTPGLGHPALEADANQATAVLEQRLADTEQRRMAAEVRVRVLEEERAKMIAEARDRLGLTRRIERLRNELRKQREEHEGVERELSESRFRLVEQESTLGQLRTTENTREQLAEVVDLVAERLEEVVDGTRSISKSGLRALVEAMRLTPREAVGAVKREIAE
ncbi:MAG: hypothetical protein AAFZ65_02980, partial [Planctomycetota bacterium]